MATLRRPPAVDGKPSIPSLREADNAMQQCINNIRSRLDKLDAAVNRAFVVVDASSPAATLESLQTQITALSNEFDILEAQIRAAANPEGSEDPGPGMMAAALAELTKAVEDLRAQPADELRPQVAELQKKVEDLQTVPADDTRALLVELTKRVQGLEEGVLA